MKSDWFVDMLINSLKQTGALIKEGLTTFLVELIVLRDSLV